MSDFEDRAAWPVGNDRFDAGLSVAELMEVAGHCNRVIAAGHYRLLQVVSRVHEQREDEYIAEVATYAEAHCLSNAEVLLRFSVPDRQTVAAVKEAERRWAQENPPPF